MAKDAMIFPFRWFDTLRMLGDAERGQMLDAIADYAERGEAPEFAGAMAALWNEFRQRIDRDREQYEAVCEKNRINGQKGAAFGKLGGRPRKTPTGDIETPKNGKRGFQNPEKPRKTPDAEAEADIKKTFANAKAKETAVSFDLFEFPDSLNFPEFREKWGEWLNYRKAKRKSVSPIAAKKQIATLAGYDLQTAIAMIDESIRNDWTGIFPPKAQAASSPRYGRQPLDVAATEARADRIARELRRIDDED